MGLQINRACKRKRTDIIPHPPKRTKTCYVPYKRKRGMRGDPCVESSPHRRRRYAADGPMLRLNGASTQIDVYRRHHAYLYATRAGAATIAGRIDKRAVRVRYHLVGGLLNRMANERRLRSEENMDNSS